MQAPEKVPIEYRPLICESIDANTGDVSTISKGHVQTASGNGLFRELIVLHPRPSGSLEMWIELLDTTTAAEIPVSKLLQPPAMEVPWERSACAVGCVCAQVALSGTAPGRFGHEGGGPAHMLDGP